MRRLAAVLGLVLLAAVVATAPAGAEPAPESAFGGVTQLSSGWSYVCGVLTTRQVRCWGSGFLGVLGTGDTDNRPWPTPVVDVDGDGPLVNITQVSGGSASTCARTAGGQARCWGDNAYGELGVGDTDPHQYAMPVVGVGEAGRLTGVVQVSTGWNHACARVTGGQVRCWGDNTEGQLGDDQPDPSSSPVVVADLDGVGPLTGATQLVAGYKFTCARLSAGRVACWGDNGADQLGDGSHGDQRRPVLVKNASGTGPLTGVARIAMTGNGGCALLTSGQARCWGFSPGGGSPFPVTVQNGAGTGPLTGITALGSGTNHRCFVVSRGRVRCQGNNLAGQLGDRTTTNRTSLVPMVDAVGTGQLSGVLSLAVGDSHTCGRLSGGRVVCLGSNLFGQLGDGTFESTTRPVGVRPAPPS
jgi:alpha-tubulin suppressor-like RCC1 family protein